jgi:hypothetical protein
LHFHSPCDTPLPKGGNGLALPAQMHSGSILARNILDDALFKNNIYTHLEQSVELNLKYEQV